MWDSDDKIKPCFPIRSGLENRVLLDTASRDRGLFQKIQHGNSAQADLQQEVDPADAAEGLT